MCNVYTVYAFFLNYLIRPLSDDKFQRRLIVILYVCWAIDSNYETLWTIEQYAQRPKLELGFRMKKFSFVLNSLFGIVCMSKQQLRLIHKFPINLMWAAVLCFISISNVLPNNHQSSSFDGCNTLIKQKLLLTKTDHHYNDPVMYRLYCRCW